MNKHVYSVKHKGTLYYIDPKARTISHSHYPQIEIKIPKMYQLPKSEFMAHLIFAKFWNWTKTIDWQRIYELQMITTLLHEYCGEYQKDEESAPMKALAWLESYETQVLKLIE